MRAYSSITFPCELKWLTGCDAVVIRVCEFDICVDGGEKSSDHRCKSVETHVWRSNDGRVLVGLERGYGRRKRVKRIAWQ